MNSRKARNEINPNTTTVVVLPPNTANRKTLAISHHARVRSFRFLIVALYFSSPSFFERIQPMIDETTSTPATAEIKARLSLSRFIDDADSKRPSGRVRGTPLCFLIPQAAS